MPSATGSQSYIALVKQDPATPRTIPENPVMQKVNFTADDLGTTIDTKVSDHIRDDRMTTDLSITGNLTEGGYVFEFQYENTKDDEMLAAALFAEQWSTPVAADIEAGTITLLGAELNLALATEKPTIIDGQRLRLSGTEDNDGVYSLTVTAAPNIYTMVPAPVADETLPAGAALNGSMIRNGKFYQPFFIERGHTDISEYFKFIGMSASELMLEFADQTDVTGGYKFMGLLTKVEEIVEPGATYVPVTNTPVYSTATNIPSVLIDGVVQEGCLVKELSLELTNNLAAKTGLGVLGACETKAHRLEITGSISMYFEDSVMYNRLLNGTPFSLSWVVEDADGQGYAFTLPRIKLDADTINVTGVDDEVMDDATYVATADPVTACMIQIDKYKVA